MKAYNMIQEVLKSGVCADDRVEDPKKRRSKQTHIHALAKEFGIKIKTEHQVVDDERLFVVWRVK